MNFIQEIKILKKQICKILEELEGGGSFKTGEIGVVASTATLSTLDNTTYPVYFSIENSTIYKYSATSQGTNIGQITGSTGFWVPQYFKGTGINKLAVGHITMPNTDGFFNDSVFSVISQQAANVPIFSFGTDSPKVSGLQFVNIDYDNASYVPEIWARGNVLPADWTCEAALTWRAIITGQHTKQIGMGINNYTTGGDISKFWTGDSNLRDDAVLFWISNNYKFNQQNNFGLSLKNFNLQFFVTGSGDVHVKGAIYTGTLKFTTDTIVSHQAATYIFEGGNGVTLTLPDPDTLDIWQSREFENLEITIINLGTDALTLSRPVKLDGTPSVLTILNNMYPDNTITIKCVAGEWIRTK